MHTPLRFFLALPLFAFLVSCDRSSDDGSSAELELSQTQAELAAARDDLERQAFEIETMSALMEKELAILRADLLERESDQLRTSLESLTRRNEELQAQAIEARVKSDLLTQRIEATPVLRAEPIPLSAPGDIVTRPSAPIQRQPIGQSPPTYPEHDYSMFYEELSPHGRWIDVDDFGYSWQPRVASNRGWRPYVDGSWVWTDYGWTWNSNEPFGWATYHYGRWANLNRVGWVWVPDQQWAPAWVSWRQSNDHVGWAPLPPSRGPVQGFDRDCDLRYNLGPSSYTFIQTNHFVNQSYNGVCSPQDRNSYHFRRSVNTTRLVPQHGYGRPVFAHRGGPARASIESSARSRVPQRQIQFDQSGRMPRGHASHQASASSPLSMIALPLAVAGTAIVAPKIVERIRDAKRVDEISSLPAQEAATLRQEISGELATVQAIEDAAEVIVASAPAVEPLNVAPTVTPEVAPEVISEAVVETGTTAPVVPVITETETPLVDPTTGVAAVATATENQSEPDSNAPAVPAITADEAISYPENTTPTMATQPGGDSIAMPLAIEETTGEVTTSPTEAPLVVETDPASADAGAPSAPAISDDNSSAATMPTVDTPALTEVAPATAEPSTTENSPTATEMASEGSTAEAGAIPIGAPAVETVPSEVATMPEPSGATAEALSMAPDVEDGPAVDSPPAMASEPTESNAPTALTTGMASPAGDTEEAQALSAPVMSSTPAPESEALAPPSSAPAMIAEETREAESMTAVQAAMAQEQAKADAMAPQQAAMAQEQAKADAMAAQQAAMAQEQAKADAMAAQQAAMAQEQAKADAMAAQQAAMAQEQAKADAMAAQQAAMA